DHRYLGAQPLSRSGAMLLRSNPRSRVAGDLQPRNGVQIPGFQRIQAAVLRLSTARSWITDARPDQGRAWSSRRRTSGAGDRRRWRRWLPTAGQLYARTQSYPQGGEDQDAADLRAGNVRVGSAPHPPRRGPSGAGDPGVQQRHDGLYRRRRFGCFHGRIQHHLRNTELAQTSDRRAARQAGARAMDTCGAPGATGRAPRPPSGPCHTDEADVCGLGGTQCGRRRGAKGLQGRSGRNVARREQPVRAIGRQRSHLRDLDGLAEAPAVATPSMASGATIGFLVKTYPKISETFILEELLGLERNGLRPHIFSIQRPTDAVCHDANRAVRAPVTYLPPTGVSSAMQGARAHLALMVKRPRRYLQALVFVLRREEGGRTRAFFQAGYLAHRLSEAGIRHLHAHFASEPAGVAELVSKLAGISYSISAHAKDIYLSSSASLRRKMS